MAEFLNRERVALEKLFCMGSGAVLRFDHRTLREFVDDAVKKDLHDPAYSVNGDSKAKLLRQFWKVEPDHIVGRLIRELTDQAARLSRADPLLVATGYAVADRLLRMSSVDDIDAIVPLDDGRTFEALATGVREAIENNKPETGLDRLHTYLIKYLRTRCAEAGLPADSDKPPVLFNSYVRYLGAAGFIKSSMTERIFNATRQTLDAFNDVRNSKSLAHDNEILGRDEALFIYSHICAVIRLLQSVDKAKLEQEEEPVEF